jgi:hypothetical protein
MATDEQKQRKEWASVVPDSTDAIALEAELARRQKEFVDLEAQIRDRRGQEAAARLGRLEEEQTLRRRQYEDEDRLLLEKVGGRATDMPLLPLLFSPTLLTLHFLSLVVSLSSIFAHS